MPLLGARLRSSRAPEALMALGAGWSVADIWALCCCEEDFRRGEPVVAIVVPLFAGVRRCSLEALLWPLGCCSSGYSKIWQRGAV